MFLCSVYFAGISAQESADTGKTDRTDDGSEDIFNAQQPIEITLSFDLGDFLRTKKEPAFYDAVCQMVWQNDTLEKNIRIKARGEMRRAYCQLPPILLKFGDSNSDGFPLKGSMKCVVPCFPTAKYETYLLKEFLVYKLFNHVTPYSLRARLIRLTIIDTGKPEKKYTAYGFIIENEKRMAERNNAVIIKNPNLSQYHMNNVDMSRIALFNYIIGNTDWSVPMQHNIRVLKSTRVTSEKAIPVAYDFDFAGFVNPPYAAPAKELPISEVKERYYMGTCSNSEALREVINEFEGLEKDFISTINEFEFLSDTEKKYSHNYIENYFRMYRNKNSILYTINRTCKQ
jgi:hypothetical protein